MVKHPRIFCLVFNSCWLSIKRNLQGFPHQWVHISFLLFPCLLFIYNVLMKKEQLFDIKKCKYGICFDSMSYLFHT